MAIPFEKSASKKTVGSRFPATGRVYRVVKVRTRKHPLTQVNTVLYAIAGVLSVACIFVSMVIFGVVCLG